MRTNPSSSARSLALCAAILFGTTATFTQTAMALNPPPDGGYRNQNTAEGDNALSSLTSGQQNTAIGFGALSNNKKGDYNTATGSEALFNNTRGFANSAYGAEALFSNTVGVFNVGIGQDALRDNVSGNNNTAVGTSAIRSNTTGSANTGVGLLSLGNNTTGSHNAASGSFALYGNTTGSENTATGYQALQAFDHSGSDNTADGNNALASNIDGNNNTAIGASALSYGSTGSSNTAAGFSALRNSTGSNNIGIGANAGVNLTSGNSNIVIDNSGVAGESGSIRIGTTGTHQNTFVAGIYGVTIAGGAAVMVDSAGHLGIGTSSARFKDAIKPMNDASESIFQLEPVTFHYKHQIDPDGIPQFGLVAEQVEKVNPDLVVRDGEGNVNTVRYDAVNAMLLNEFLKEHNRVEDQARKSEEQQATITELKSVLAEQQEQIRKLTTAISKKNGSRRLNREK